LSLDRKLCLACGPYQPSNDLVELGGEGDEDPDHHNVVQSSLIDGRIGDIGEDVVVKGVATKCEKYEVVPPHVIGRRGFHNDRNH
jgi:hypothetical protein